MKGIELTYAMSGSFTTLAGTVMIIAYSLSAPWWRSHTGRMLVSYAIAETGMSAIFAAATTFHINPVWFRVVWVGLQATVGVVLWYQTAMIIKFNRQSTKEGEQK